MDIIDTQSFEPLTQVTGDSARDRLLDTACRLFYRHGINSVGIDTIIEEAGVAKMSLYRHFGSKNGLVAAYLEHRDNYWQRMFQDRLLALDIPARDKLLVYFDLIGAWFESKNFCGCAYINADAERVEDDIRAIVTRHKEWTRTMLEDLAEQAGIHNFRVVAAQLYLLSEGAFVAARLERSAEPARVARAAAETLIGSQPT